MKLGFLLQNTNIGVQEALRFNENQFLTKEDIRPAIKTLENFDCTGKMVYLLRFIGKGGYLFALIKARPSESGRPNDNTAAFIHVPVNVAITGEEMHRVIKSVTEALGKYSNDEEKLKSVFAKDYPEKDIATTIVSRIESNPSMGYATVYFGVGTEYGLEELLGDGIAQVEYSQYKGVFFIDKTSGINSCNKEIIPNPKKVITLDPLNKIGGFIPKLDGKLDVSKQKIEVLEGDQLTIEWEKEGYATVKKSCTISKRTSDDAQEWPSSVKIQPNEYKVIIRRDMFRVVDKKNRKSLNAQIKVNGECLDNDGLEISEAKYNEGLCVEITAKGYEKMEINNWKNEEKIVEMKKEEITRNLKTQIYDRNHQLVDAKITITSEDGLNENEPLRGYRYENNETICYHPTFNWMDYIKGVVSGMFISIVLCFIAVFVNDGRGPEQVGPVKEQPTQIEKLLNKSQWEKPEFENAGYVDLWNALNEYDFDKVKNLVGQDAILSSNDNVKKILAQIEENGNRGNTLFINEYCTDRKINVNNYLIRLNKDAKRILSQSKWNKIVLDSISEFKNGALWDAVNTYDLEKLTDTFKGLKGVGNYDIIVDVLERNIDKFDALKEKNNGKYCPENDKNISINTYKDKIEKPETTTPREHNGADQNHDDNTLDSGS